MSYLRASAFICGSFLFAAWAHAADWPQLLGPQRDGHSPETSLNVTWPQDGPPIVWQRKVGEGFSGPVVAEGKLILFHRVGNEEVVECLNAASGEVQWKFAYATQFADDFNKGNGPRSTPVIAGKRVVTLGADGWLHCLDLEKGSKLWGRNLIQDYAVPTSYFGVGSSPVAEQNLVLVNVGGKNAGIVAFTLATGKEQWKATSDEAGYSSPVVGAMAGKRLAAFLTRQGVVLLDPASGKIHHTQRWRARIDASVNAAMPVLVGDHAFFSSSYETGALLLRVTPSGAEEVWKGDEILSSHYNTSIYYKDHLYGLDGRQEAGARLRCVEFKTGKILWTQKGFGCCSFILAAGHLLGITERGDLVSVEATPEGFREKARAHIFDASPCRAEIALADGRLFARDQQRLACFNLKK